MAGLGDLFDALDRTVLTVAGDAISYSELFGFLTGGICVALTVRAHVANFPIGLLNCAFFGLLFLSAELYTNSALQLVFFVLGVIGWWQWVRRDDRNPSAGGPDEAGPAPPDRSRPLTYAPPRVVIAGLAVTAAATSGLTFVLAAVDDPEPFWDAFTTALSLVAQYLLNTKRVQSWYFWMAADVIYVPLYLTQGLTLTAVIYALFLGMCVLGLRDWRRAALALTNAPSARALPAAGMTGPD